MQRLLQSHLNQISRTQIIFMFQYQLILDGLLFNFILLSPVYSLLHPVALGHLHFPNNVDFSILIAKHNIATERGRQRARVSENRFQIWVCTLQCTVYTYKCKYPLRIYCLSHFLEGISMIQKKLYVHTFALFLRGLSLTLFHWV